MKRLVLVALLLVAGAVPAHAQVRVGVDIGINLPGPPAFVVVPGTPVYYAPQAPGNVFFYANQYWAFVNGAWYVGPTLERSVGGDAARLRSGADSLRAGPVLPRAASGLAGMAS